jgi:hypothetical protein
MPRARVPGIHTDSSENRSDMRRHSAPRRQCAASVFPLWVVILILTSGLGLLGACKTSLPTVQAPPPRVAVPRKAASRWKVRLYCDNRLATLHLDSALPAAYVGNCQAIGEWLHVRHETVVAGGSPTALEAPIPGFANGIEGSYWGLWHVPSLDHLPNVSKLRRALRLELRGNVAEASTAYRRQLEETPRRLGHVRTALAARALELSFWHQQRACVHTGVATASKLVARYRSHLLTPIGGQTLPLPYVEDRLFRTKLHLLVSRRYHRLFRELRWRHYKAPKLQAGLPRYPALTGFARRPLRVSGPIGAAPIRSPSGFIRRLADIVGQRSALLAVGGCNTFDRAVRARLFRLAVTGKWVVLPIATTPCRTRGLYSGGYELLSTARTMTPTLVRLTTNAKAVQWRREWTAGSLAALLPGPNPGFDTIRQALRDELIQGRCATQTVDDVERRFGTFASEYLIETIREHRGAGARIAP